MLTLNRKIMRILILAITILISTIGFSQATNSQSVIKNIEKGETNKVVLDVSMYSPQNVSSFKEELMHEKTQITLVHYNDVDKIFTFIYNDQINIEKITTIFDKNGINHIINTSTQLYKN